VTVTLTTHDVTAERMQAGRTGVRYWREVSGRRHVVTVGYVRPDDLYFVVHETEGDHLNPRRTSHRYFTPLAALAAFHAIGPGIHPPRLLTERETETV
jgi:hypothetical protein